MSSSNHTVDPPFAAGAGVQTPISQSDDPYLELDEFMAVVEALCPEWPAREPFATPAKMLR